jgi:ATP-binding cassette subfamily C protein
MSATAAAAAPPALLPPVGRAAAAGLLALCLALSFAAQGALLAVPLLTMHVYDGVLASRNMDTLAALALAYVAAVLLGGALRHLRAALLAAVAERAARRLQLRALPAAVRSALDGPGGGDRARGLAALRDVAELRRSLGGGVASDLFDLAAIPVVLAVLFLLHPLYFWVGLGGCALLAALGGLADRATRGLVREASAASARTAADLAGRLRQPDLLDGLGMLPAVLRRWRPQQARALEGQDAAQRRARALQGLAGLAQHGQQMAMVAAGGWLVTRHAASPGSILAATLLAGMATAPVGRLIGTWRDWAFAAVAWRRLRALVADAAPPAPRPPEPDAPPGLLVEALTCRPEGAPRPLVRGLSLRLPPGEMLVVVGSNGTGKTTLLRALLGLAPAEAGRALLDGQDLRRADRAALGPRIGYLPQGGQLLAGSVLDNIARFRAAGASPAEAVAAARRAGAHEAIGRLPEGYASAAAGPLSGGQRQLVALARALFGAPRLLVLDEPEAGLDQPALEALRAGVAAAKAEGAAVVVVTHQPGHWAGLAERTLRLLPGGEWRVDTHTTERHGHGTP